MNWQVRISRCRGNFVPMKKLLLVLLLVLNGSASADTLYFNARFYTVNPDQPLARALHVVDGKIAFIGSEEAARAKTDNKTEFVDSFFNK